MAETAPLILVVDDDPDFVEMHRDILEGAGFRVIEAYNPETAFDLVRQADPDLVVTDLMMTALDSGFSLARRVWTHVREGRGRIPLIVITAVASRRGYDFVPRSPAELQAMAADAFFTKPVQPLQLLERVRALLTEHSEEQGTRNEERGIRARNKGEQQ